MVERAEEGGSLGVDTTAIDRDCKPARGTCYRAEAIYHVNFLHRTVRDFIQESLTVKELFSEHSVTEIRLRTLLCQGYLAIVKSTRWIAGTPESLWDTPAVFRQLRELEVLGVQPAPRDVMEELGKLHQTEHGIDVRSGLGLHFGLARYGLLTTESLSILYPRYRTLDVSLNTHLLDTTLMGHCDYRFKDHPPYATGVRQLLHLGAGTVDNSVAMYVHQAIKKIAEDGGHNKTTLDIVESLVAHGVRLSGET